MIPSILHHNFAGILSDEEMNLYQNVIYSWFSTDESYQNREIELLISFLTPDIQKEKKECEKRQNVIRIVCMFASSMLVIWLI